VRTPDIDLIRLSGSLRSRSAVIMQVPHGTLSVVGRHEAMHVLRRLLWCAIPQTKEPISDLQRHSFKLCLDRHQPLHLRGSTQFSYWN